MRASFATTCILAGALLASGCATKSYVRSVTAPIQAKVDQVGEQTTQNTQQIQDTRNQVKQVDEHAQSGINAAQERASAADQHATEAMNRANEGANRASDAMNRANQGVQASDQNAQGLNSLRNVVANIDDYKLQTSATVPFQLNRYSLTTEAKDGLDKLVGEVKSDKRFFIAVEGYTDKTGSAAYNDALSRRRADSVVQYLVAQHDIPIYRVHMIGLGEAKPVDEAHNRAARAKNRRVEVKVFSADQVTASLGTTSTTQQTSSATVIVH